jgi:hypothetical protein
MALGAQWIAAVLDPDGSVTDLFLLYDDLDIADRNRWPEWRVVGLRVDTTASEYTVEVHAELVDGRVFDLSRSVSDGNTKSLTIPTGQRPVLGDLEFYEIGVVF